MATKLTPEKKDIIANLIQMYDVKTMKDIQEYNVPMKHDRKF